MVGTGPNRCLCGTGGSFARGRLLEGGGEGEGEGRSASMRRKRTIILLLHRNRSSCLLCVFLIFCGLLLQGNSETNTRRSVFFALAAFKP